MKWSVTCNFLWRTLNNWVWGPPPSWLALLAEGHQPILLSNGGRKASSCDLCSPTNVTSESKVQYFLKWKYCFSSIRMLWSWWQDYIVSERWELRTVSWIISFSAGRRDQTGDVRWDKWQVHLFSPSCRSSPGNLHFLSRGRLHLVFRTEICPFTLRKPKLSQEGSFNFP